MGRLKTESASPLYLQLMQRIREDIDRGIYPVGSRIPPEHELVETYQVSRVTVRRALSELTAERRLERKQGKGTFVSAPRISQELKNIHSYHDTCAAAGIRPGTQVIRVWEQAADADDCRDLNLRADDRVIETLRVRTADGVPVVLEKNHFSMAYAYLEESDLNGSLYSVLREYGVEPKQAIHDISMSYATAEQARYLNVEAGTALLHLKEVIYDQKGRPLHSSRQWIRGDRFVFRI